jgi:hypothetical protein
MCENSENFPDKIFVSSSFLNGKGQKKKVQESRKKKKKGVGPSDANLSTPERLLSPVGCAIFCLLCREGFSLFIYLPYFILLFSMSYPPFFLKILFPSTFLFFFFFPQLRNWNNNKNKKGGVRLLFVRSTGHLSHPFPFSFFFFSLLSSSSSLT